MFQLVTYILLSWTLLVWTNPSQSITTIDNEAILASSVRGATNNVIFTENAPTTPLYSSERIAQLSQAKGILYLTSCDLEELNQPKEDTRKKIRTASQKPSSLTKSIAKENRPSAVVKNYTPETETIEHAPSQVLDNTDLLINAAGYAYEWGKKMLRSRKYHPGKSITYCNTFTVDLTNRILGNNSPFGDNWINWLQENGKAGRAHHMHEYCMEKAEEGEFFEEITGETLNDRFKKAWEATREGKLVIFTSPQRARNGKRTEPGHFAVAIPTEEGDFRISRDSKGNEYFVGKVVQAGRSILDGDKKINGRGGHSYLSAAWRADHFEGIKILVCKGTGTP